MSPPMLRKVGTWVVIGCLAGAALAAPLPWHDAKTQDALRFLSESGVLGESWLAYRAATRWEIAAVAERLLRLQQAQPQLFASKQEREALQSLLAEMRPELEALGVRVQTLEDSVAQLDGRTEQLERIKFRGQFLMTALYQGVQNTGNEFSGFGPGALDYQRFAGSTELTNLVPHAPQGILPQVDLALGRPLVEGAGLSSTLFLEVEHQPNEDFVYELRLYAYTSQGNALVDAIWGTQQPYLANPFTGSGGGTLQSSNRAPFSSAGFDRFRLNHIPSGFGVTLGSFTPRLISSSVFTGQINPRVGDPRLLDSFGVHATSEHDQFSWEALGTYLPDGNPRQLGLEPLQNLAWGGALHYHNAGWQATLSYLQASAESRDGSARAVGLTNLVNGPSGRVNVNWVNPPGYFAGQLIPGYDPRGQQTGAPVPTAVAGRGSTSDARPVAGRAGLDGGGLDASFGPQQQSSFGAQLGHRGDWWSVQGEWAHTVYRPHQNAGYSRSGDLYSFGGTVEFDEGNLQLGLDYRSTDASYDPMILSFPSPSPGLTPFRAYHRFPDHDQFWHLYSLHDTDRFPHNRKGFWPSLKWRYQEDSHLELRARFLEQVQTSLQDVRYRPDQLGVGVPNELVLGHSPGFLDVVFREFSPLAFDANLVPLENQRGSVQALGLSWRHDFAESPWALEGAYDRFHFDRPTGLPASLGGSQNRVNLTHSVARLGVTFTPSQEWSYGLHYSLAQMKGHYDPFGVYNQFAIATSDTDFLNRDSVQHAPTIQATWNLDAQTRWDVGFTYYSVVDRVPATTFAGAPGGPFSAAHPFSYNGYRVETRMEVNF
jgi:hypothetical protein